MSHINTHIAESIGVTVITVREWRKRYASEGIDSLTQVKTGRGRKRVIDAQVHVQDDFLDLGGDSLQAMRVLSHLRSATGVELAMADFFHQPTVEALARRIKGARQERPDHPAIRLKDAQEAAERARMSIATATSANDNLDLRRPARRRGPAPE